MAYNLYTHLSHGKNVRQSVLALVHRAKQHEKAMRGGVCTEEGLSPWRRA